MVMRFFVKADGVPSDTRVDVSSGHELLDAAAMAWIQDCRFSPAIVDGKPRPGWVKVPVAFNSPRPLPPAGDPCDPRYPEYPVESRRNGETGTVVLRVHVQADGWLSEISVRKSSGFPRLDAAAAEWIMNCRFKPATRDGAPIDAWASQTYTFNLKD